MKRFVIRMTDLAMEELSELPLAGGRVGPELAKRLKCCVLEPLEFISSDDLERPIALRLAGIEFVEKGQK